MSNYLDLIFSGPSQLLPVIVAVLLWIGLAGLGNLVTDRSRLVEANVFYGWAVFSTIFTLVGTLVRAPFLIITIILGLFALIGLVRARRHREPLFTPGAWRILILAFPLLFIAGAMDPSQWDEFSHWLPAPKYLLAFDGFPNAERPYNGPHMLSAYPYGWPILSYLTGRIAGGFIDNIGGTLNLFLLLTFVSLLMRMSLRAVAGIELHSM